jgi:hypothetical protein
MNKLEKVDPEFLLEAVNHFTVNLTIKCTERPTGKKRHDEHGQLKPETYLCEKTPYTRVLKTTKTRKSIGDLTTKGLWLFNYIFLHIDQGKDYFQINAEHFNKWSSFTSENTLRDAIKELMKKGFISSTGVYKTVFWINPEIFYPGNRITAFPDNLEITPYIYDTASSRTPTTK